jgi:hypothetical protein
MFSKPKSLSSRTFRIKKLSAHQFCSLSQIEWKMDSEKRDYNITTWLCWCGAQFLLKKLVAYEKRYSFFLRGLNIKEIRNTSKRCSFYELQNGIFSLSIVWILRKGKTEEAVWKCTQFVSHILSFKILQYDIL